VVLPSVGGDTGDVGGGDGWQGGCAIFFPRLCDERIRWGVSHGW
jgi:hypothetical protein